MLGEPGAASDEHLLAGVVVRRGEGDALPAVAVDRHRVGHEVDVVLGLQAGQAVGVGDDPVLDVGSPSVAEDRLGDLLEHVDVEALDLRSVIGLRAPNSSVSAETPTISRPRSWIAAIVVPAGISPGVGSGPSGA